MVDSLSKASEAEEALEKLRQEHDEMVIFIFFHLFFANFFDIFFNQFFSTFSNTLKVEMVNKHFAKMDHELQQLRSLVLEPAFEGWLSKQGGGNISRAWKERFFVLRNGVLSYFKSEGDEAPAGSVYIGEATVNAVSSSVNFLIFFLSKISLTHMILSLFFKKKWLFVECQRLV